MELTRGAYSPVWFGFSVCRGLLADWLAFCRISFVFHAGQWSSEKSRRGFCIDLSACCHRRLSHSCQDRVLCRIFLIHRSWKVSPPLRRGTTSCRLESLYTRETKSLFRHQCKQCTVPHDESSQPNLVWFVPWVGRVVGGLAQDLTNFWIAELELPWTDPMRGLPTHGSRRE